MLRGGTAMLSLLGSEVDNEDESSVVDIVEVTVLDLERVVVVTDTVGGLEEGRGSE